MIHFVKNHCSYWTENEFEAGLVWNQTGKMGVRCSSLDDQWWAWTRVIAMEMDRGRWMSEIFWRLNWPMMDWMWVGMSERK